MIKNYKNEALIVLLLVGFSLAFYFLYGILLPFCFGLILAFSASHIISRIQKIVRNKDLAATLFLAVITSLIVFSFVFLTPFINRDFKRLNQSFTLLVSKNQESLDKNANKAKNYIGHFYDLESLEGTFKLDSDSLISSFKDMDFTQLDTESMTAGFEKVTSIFQNDKEPTKDNKPHFGVIFMLFSTLSYFVLMLYQLDYFRAIQKKYFSRKVSASFQLILNDFNQSFLKYLKLRTKIVLLLSLLYLVAFIILDMPGMILITVLIILLSYIPYLQYLALIPLSISCLVLSVENSQNFLLFYSIVVGVFVLASIAEELLLIPWIMEKNIGMNPVIMVLALSIWSYILGLPGTFLAIPMTSLMIIYFKRYIVPSYKKVLQD